MTGRERVLRTLAFEEPDRVPRFFAFWEEFNDQWRDARGWGPGFDLEEHFGSDMKVVVADETAWPLEDNILGTLEAAGGGGLIVSCGIADDVSVETMEYVLELLDEYGSYPLKAASSFGGDGGT